MIVDYFGKELKVGDDILYMTCNGHDPIINEGKVLQVDYSRNKYGCGQCVQVLGKENKRPGWTYAKRIIKLIESIKPTWGEFKSPDIVIGQVQHITPNPNLPQTPPTQI